MTKRGPALAAILFVVVAGPVAADMTATFIDLGQGRRHSVTR